MASVAQLTLLLLCISYRALAAHAGDERSYKVLSASSLNPGAVCSEPKVSPPSSSGGATVPLNHRHGRCSPVPTEKKQPTFTELLRRDQLRANYIQHKFSKDDTGGLQQSEATVPTALGSPLDTLEYVITVGLGSPAVAQTMSIDTGSDVSWVRCRRSKAGSPFDPSKSSTYAPFSCSAPACAQLGREGNKGCSSAGSACQYTVRYGDGSSTTGTYGSDTLALLQGSDAVTGFQFGCSAAEQRFDDGTDGLMGLGGDAESLVSQTAATYGKAFSYCLPPTTDSSGFLTLGAPSSTSAAFSKTRMLRSTRSATFYGVLLRGIRVGGKTLSGVPASVFSAGSVVDSGTIVTRLPPTAYEALSSAFKEGMRQYPPAEPLSILDTCFDFTGQENNVTIPSVALVLDGGAVVDLDPNGIILSSCLAFAATEDDRSTGIIGNVQQRTFEVLYDVGQSVFGFRPGAC